MSSRYGCLFSLNKSVAMLSQGCLGNLELINGSLIGGASFIQVEHFLTNSSVCAETPGHHTDVDTCKRHRFIP